jgi:MFS family permease
MKELSMSAGQPASSDHWLNRNVVGLAVNRFLSDLGHEAGTSILPLFLAAIGAPASALGLIEGVADGLSSFAKLLGGWLGDRVERRKPWAAGGYLLTGLTTGLYGLFAWWPWILLVRGVGWAGRGLRSPLHDALLTDSIPATARGRAFGFDEAADTAGAVAGPLAAMAIVGLAPGGLHGLRNFYVVFWLAAIPGILAAVSIVALVAERDHPILRETSLIGSLRLLPSSFRRYLAGVFVFGCGDFSHTMLILYAVQSLTGRYGQSARTIAIGLYALHNVLYAVGSYPAGALADRYGKGRFLLAAYALASLMNLVLIVAAPSVATLLVVFVLAGAAYALQQSLERAIAADMAPIEVRSTGFGALASANGIGDLVSSVIVGTLWTTVSPVAGFCYAMAMSVAGAIVTGAALRAVGDS